MSLSEQNVAPGINSSPIGAKDADDLLAKLAGDEIDRLLAEADAERPGTLPSTLPLPSSLPMPSAALERSTPTAPLVHAVGTVDDPGGHAAAYAGGTETAKAPGGSAAEIDSLLGSIGSSGRGTGEVAAAGLTAEVDATEQARLDQLARDLELDTPRASTQGKDREVVAGGEERPSLLLRLLIWINSPVAGRSQAFRAAMGVVGVVTMLNAMALLTYVMVFRRHHS